MSWPSKHFATQMTQHAHAEVPKALDVLLTSTPPFLSGVSAVRLASRAGVSRTLRTSSSNACTDAQSCADAHVMPVHATQMHETCASAVRRVLQMPSLSSTMITHDVWCMPGSQQCLPSQMSPQRDTPGTWRMLRPPDETPRAQSLGQPYWPRSF